MPEFREGQLFPTVESIPDYKSGIGFAWKGRFWIFPSTN
jgi:hypothetical protein